MPGDQDPQVIAQVDALIASVGARKLVELVQARAANRKRRPPRMREVDQRLILAAEAIRCLLLDRCDYGPQEHPPTQQDLINAIVAACWVRDDKCDRNGNYGGHWDEATCKALELPTNLGASPAAVRLRLRGRPQVYFHWAADCDGWRATEFATPHANGPRGLLWKNGALPSWPTSRNLRGLQLIEKIDDRANT